MADLLRLTADCDRLLIRVGLADGRRTARRSGQYEVGHPGRLTLICEISIIRLCACVADEAEAVGRVRFRILDLTRHVTILLGSGTGVDFHGLTRNYRAYLRDFLVTDRFCLRVNDRQRITRNEGRSYLEDNVQYNKCDMERLISMARRSDLRRHLLRNYAIRQLGVFLAGVHENLLDIYLRLSTGRLTALPSLGNNGLATR